tara:strand:+ start:27164 stop:27589 length:426 start_codon:yes stop_codon:yes gene_type:complete
MGKMITVTDSLMKVVCAKKAMCKSAIVDLPERSNIPPANKAPRPVSEMGVGGRVLGRFSLQRRCVMVLTMTVMVLLMMASNAAAIQVPMALSVGESAKEADKFVLTEVGERVLERVNLLRRSAMGKTMIAMGGLITSSIKK